MTTAGRAVWSLEVTEIERLAAAQADARMEHQRTAAGPFRMRLRAASLGPVSVQSNDVSSAYIACGAIRPDRYGLLFTTGGPVGGSRFNGVVTGRDDIHLARPGGEVLSHAGAGQAWAALFLDPACHGPLLEAIWPAGTQSLYLPGRLQAAPGLRRLVLEVGEMAVGDPARLVAGPVAGALAEALSVEVAALLAGRPERPPPLRLRHLRAAGRAMEYLDTVLAQPVYTEDVARALAVGPRVLSESFDAVFGMSLHRYLRIRRLNLARRRLLDGREATLVKTVALDLGFWHLGRFSQAYRDLFGESPSETLGSRAG